MCACVCVRRGAGGGGGGLFITHLTICGSARVIIITAQKQNRGMLSWRKSELQVAANPAEAARGEISGRVAALRS